MSTNRRDFLKKTITAAAAIPVLGSSSSLFAQSFDSNTWSKLSNVDLLATFDQWVDEYVVEIKKEKANRKEFKNNQALVDLPAQMEEMMPVFKERFQDADFMKSYLKISRKLTTEIDAQF